MNAERDPGKRLPSIAAVIPVGPGDRSWRELLPVFERLAPGIPRQLVFAQGDLQSRPKDPAIRWIDCQRGRARQQNAGATLTSAEWLWFVHADSRPDGRTFAGLAHFLASGDDALGYFDLRFADDGPALMRLTEWGTRMRCRWFGLPFGDQGLVLRRERFAALGGFDESRSYGEDHALVWAARRAGLPLVRIPAVLTTSARKYRDGGWLATTWRHQRRTWQQAWVESRTG